MTGHLSVGRVAEAIANALAVIFDRPMRALQRLVGLQRFAWIFLLPNLAAILLFSLLPAVLNIYYALSGSDRLYPRQRPFVGLDNFGALLECERYGEASTCRHDLFWRAIENTLVFVPIQITVMIGTALLTALILNRDIVARGFFRGVFFFPVMLSPVVVALVWKWILQRNGILNSATGAFGFEPVGWLSEPGSAFFWSVFVTVWANVGFYTLILLAGLQAIPRDLYEAAQMDRASSLRMFRRITLPLLAPTMLVVLVLATIRSVQTFDELYVLTGGGPGSATMLLLQYIYETGFASQPRNFGLAAAASVLMGAVLMALMLLQMRWRRRDV